MNKYKAPSLTNPRDVATYLYTFKSPFLSFAALSYSFVLTSFVDIPLTSSQVPLFFFNSVLTVAAILLILNYLRFSWPAYLRYHKTRALFSDLAAASEKLATRIAETESPSVQGTAPKSEPRTLHVTLVRTKEDTDT